MPRYTFCTPSPPTSLVTHLGKKGVVDVVCAIGKFAAGRGTTDDGGGKGGFPNCFLLAVKSKSKANGEEEKNVCAHPLTSYQTLASNSENKVFTPKGA